MRSQASILIVEPSDIIIEGLRAIVGDNERFNILAPLHDAVGLKERLLVQQPDILVVNPTLLAMPLRQTLTQLQQTRPEMAIVALVYQYLEPSVLQMFQKTIDIRDNCSIVVACLIESGEKSHEVSDGAESYELSDRELDVLVLVAKGLSSKEIADKLNISIHTVNSHRKNITHKTGIKSVAGLAVYATIHNLA